MSQARIKSQKSNFSEWYESIVEHAELAQKSSFKGSFLILPRAWAIWEQIQKFINSEFVKLKVENVAFPTALAVSDLEKEKQHVEGFAPELFLLANKNSSNQQFALRPTSEILFCHYFKTNLQSYSQLPFKLNQWCNVFRMEKNTKAFLRTTEFHWQELHTLHASATEAKDFVQLEFAIYQQCLSQLLNIAFLAGPKSVNERFAGAEATYTLESLMPDGQMLQSCTAHYLGTNFAQSFNIQFVNQQNQKVYPYQTAAGLSTRILGAIIMNHGDDYGLVLPFQVAPIQVVLLDLFKEHNDLSTQKLKQIIDVISDYRYEVDDSQKSFGYKIQNQEIYGTPFVLAFGNKELAKNQILVVNRLDRIKHFVPLENLGVFLKEAITNYQTQMYAKSLQNLKDNIVECDNWQAVINTVQNNQVALAPWFDDSVNEDQLKAQKLGFGVRCLFIPNENQTYKCVFSNKTTNSKAYFARSY